MKLDLVVKITKDVVSGIEKDICFGVFDLFPYLSVDNCLLCLNFLIR